MKELNEASSEKAMRILKWIACSLRLMKAHEIRDGILFHTKGSELNEKTKVKVIEGFFDLCKPLIEEGPKNTLDFVHYSAKEWVCLISCKASANCSTITGTFFISTADPS